MKVKDLCTRTVQTLDPEQSLAAAVRIMWEFDCGSVPAVDGQGRVVGMITDRDISIATATRGRLASDIRIQDAMSQPVHACSPDDEVSAALNAMWTHKVRRLAVVDASGRLQGILSVNDLVLRANELGLPATEVLHTLKAICAHRESSNGRVPRKARAAAKV